MKVTMLLADAAQAVDNKLYILGGGWSIIGPTPSPSAIALKLEVPWDQTNKKHSIELALFDADGKAVVVATPQGDQPVQVNGQFEVGRLPGLAPGTPIDLALAFNFGAFPLPPGGRFTWRLSINNESDEDWQVSFSTRSLG